MRLWRYEQPDRYWCTLHEAIAKNFIHALKDEEFKPQGDQIPEAQSISSAIETNHHVNFPGFNLDIIKDKYKCVGEINKKQGGVLCTNREILVAELKAREGFTYMFSPKKEDYLKCKNARCGKRGIYAKHTCVCGKVSYCSEDCQESDYSHQNECQELIRRQLDP